MQFKLKSFILYPNKIVKYMQYNDFMFLLIITYGESDGATDLQFAFTFTPMTFILTAKEECVYGF